MFLFFVVETFVLKVLFVFFFFLEEPIPILNSSRFPTLL